MRVKFKEETQRIITFYPGNEYPIIEHGDYGWLLVETMNGVRSWIDGSLVEIIEEPENAIIFNASA